MTNATIKPPQTSGGWSRKERKAEDRAKRGSQKAAAIRYAVTNG